MWTAYGRSKSEDKPKEKKQLEVPPEVIGSNQQLTAAMESIRDPGSHDPDKSMVADQINEGKPGGKDKETLPPTKGK